MGRQASHKSLVRGSHIRRWRNRDQVQVCVRALVSRSTVGANCDPADRRGASLRHEWLRERQQTEARGPEIGESALGGSLRPGRRTDRRGRLHRGSAEGERVRHVRPRRLPASACSAPSPGKGLLDHTLDRRRGQFEPAVLARKESEDGRLRKEQELRSDLLSDPSSGSRSRFMSCG